MFSGGDAGGNTASIGAAARGPRKGELCGSMSRCIRSAVCAAGFDVAAAGPKSRASDGIECGAAVFVVSGTSSTSTTKRCLGSCTRCCSAGVAEATACVDPSGWARKVAGAGAGMRSACGVGEAGACVCVFAVAGVDVSAGVLGVRAPELAGGGADTKSMRMADVSVGAGMVVGVGVGTGIGAGVSVGVAVGLGVNRSAAVVAKEESSVRS